MKKILNILLVDDDEVDVMTVQRAFKKNQIPHNLFVASNGLEALTILEGKDPKIKYPRHHRIILLDLNMPKMSGIEFLRELRLNSTLRQIPVIILTTSNEDKDKIEAYNLNVAGYILKPVTFPKLVETVTTIHEYWSLNEII
ncbi:MAG: response regulator [Chroococcales cyanobacterium]